MFRVAFGGVTLAALAACNAAAPAGSTDTVDPGAVTSDPTVVASDLTFSPDSSTVEVGTTVMWVFDDDIPHNVVGEGFESEVMQTGTFTHTFTDSGTYPYVCTLHPNMEGTVVVVDG
jgi:plastocyanin